MWYVSGKNDRSHQACMAASHKDREYRIERCASRLMKDGIPPTYCVQYTSVHSEHSYASRPVCHRLTIEWSNDEGHHPSPSNASLPFNLPLPRFQSQQKSSPRLRTATFMKVSPSSSLSANNKSSPQQHRTGEMFQGAPR
jgi:hypothetical protein